MTPGALPLAHEAWFTHGEHPSDWSFTGESATLALLASAVAVTVLVRMLARRWPGLDVPALGRLTPYMPFAIRIHLVVSLVGLLSLGYFLSPAMDLQADLAGIALGTVMAVVTVAMVVGWRARGAALLLLAAGPIGMLEFGVLPVLQRFDLVGLALFVLFAGPGRWSADVETGRTDEFSLGSAARAVWSLRVAAGVALIVVAFAEKLANPGMALEFLRSHPDFNVAQLVGLGMSDLEFTRFAGGVEVLFGLLLISGAVPQICVLVAAIPFNTTLWFFGNAELVGHLPIYATLLVLLVYGSDSSLRETVSDPWPWRRPRRRPAGFPQPLPRRIAHQLAWRIRISRIAVTASMRTDPYDPQERLEIMNKFFQYAGIAASVVLIAFGIGATVIGFNGRDRVSTELAREKIVGTPDSTIPNQLVNTGSEAQAFAKVMRKHTLEATGGKTFAQMPRFLDAAGKGTNDEKAAAKDPKSGEPAANPARNIWVTSTALSTALNTAYFAESMATFVIVMGVALLLTGIGFLVLTLRVLRQLSATTQTQTRRQPTPAVAVPH